VIPQSFIQDLLARLDIVDVVGRYVKLRKAGANYQACCPFHNEKTPSFTVSPTKQFYHCFGCGAHGSAIGFVMQHAGLGFVDAVHELAASAGLQVPEEQRRDPTGPAPHQDDGGSLAEVLLQAARYYREQLKASPQAIAYLKGRGLTGEIAARFGIGYAPAGWRNLERVFPDYGAADLLAAGLVIESEQGRRYDRFRDRIMFPILDGRGRVIGFGGRVLAGEDGPKYLNSPETPLFEKGRELYGLPQARKAIREHDAVIVVEGYMDVVGLAQYGVENVVATLGTATTATHVQKLLRAADRVVFCFDKDAAGYKAAWRSLEVSLEHVSDAKSVGFLFMEGTQDPDEYVRAHGAERFLAFANQPKPLSEFLVAELIRVANPSTAEGRARLLHEAKPLLGRVQAPLLRLAIVKELAKRSGFSQQEIESACGLRSAPQWAGARRAPAASRRAPPSIARTLLKLLLQKPGWAPGLPLAHLPEDAEGLALRALCDAVDHGELPAVGFGGVLEFFRDSPHQTLFDEIAGELSAENFDESAMEPVFNDALEQLRRAGLSQEIAALNAKGRAGAMVLEDRLRLKALLAEKQRLGASPRGSAGGGQDSVS
jgi:DNA primase